MTVQTVELASVFASLCTIRDKHVCLALRALFSVAKVLGCQMLVVVWCYVRQVSGRLLVLEWPSVVALQWISLLVKNETGIPCIGALGRRLLSFGCQQASVFGVWLVWHHSICRNTMLWQLFRMGAAVEFSMASCRKCVFDWQNLYFVTLATSQKDVFGLTGYF